MGIALRPYQENAVAWGLARQPGTRSVAVLPTGGGKTVIAANLMNQHLQQGRRQVFFAHRRELIGQTVKKLVAEGVSPRDIGVLMGANSWNVMAPILVASIDTWIRRSPAPADVVYIDECHRSGSASYKKVLGYYSDAVVIGFTATPTGYLGDLYHDLYEIAKPSELIACRAIMEPVIYGTEEAIDLSGLKLSAGDFQADELERRVNTVTLVGNLLQTWLKYANGRPTVCFAAGIEHSRHIVATFRDAGVAAEHLDGETPTGERAAILARLERGQTVYVSNCAVLTEGWDCPTVKCVQLARPTKSLPMYLQSVGRGLRPTEDGTVPIVLDHALAHVYHGFPCEDRDWYLRQKGERKQVERNPALRKCSKCQAIVLAAVLTCKHCGHTIEQTVEVLETSNELVEITDPKLARWNQLVTKWREQNNNRLARNQAPIKRYWIVKQYESDMGEKPPRKFVPPPEMYIPSDDELHSEFAKLKAVCSDRGIVLSWAHQKLTERFGKSVVARLTAIDNKDTFANDYF